MPAIPVIASDFQPLYIPGPAAFPGPESVNLKTGEWREAWIANDHTLIQGPDGRWHAFGIIAPETPIPHEGTWMAFHAVGAPGTFRDSIAAGLWEEHPKVLPSDERPGERRELWAPFVFERRGLYHMYYGPCEMRHAVSADLFRWEPQGVCFEQEGGARDPWVLEIGGLAHMIYVAGSSVWLRTSEDLHAWSEPCDIFPMRRPGNPESPMLVEREGVFYLFWTICDGENGNYDDRTFVFASADPRDFRKAEELTMLLAHAPELVQDAGGQWFITSVERPRRGVSVARLDWRE